MANLHVIPFPFVISNEYLGLGRTSTDGIILYDSTKLTPTPENVLHRTIIRILGAGLIGTSDKRSGGDYVELRSL